MNVKDRMTPRLRILCTVQRRRQQEGEAGTAGVCSHPGRKFLLPRLWWWSMKLILHETTAATVVLQGISRTSYKQTKPEYNIRCRSASDNSKQDDTMHLLWVACICLTPFYLIVGLVDCWKYCKGCKNFSLSPCSSTLVFRNHADLLVQIGYTCKGNFDYKCNKNA